VWSRKPILRVARHSLTAPQFSLARHSSSWPLAACHTQDDATIIGSKALALTSIGRWSTLVVLVQREMESWRARLANITPSSLARLYRQRPAEGASGR
jgi:hypothetical protein